MMARLHMSQGKHALNLLCSKSSARSQYNFSSSLSVPNTGWFGCLSEKRLVDMNKLNTCVDTPPVCQILETRKVGDTYVGVTAVYVIAPVLTVPQKRS
jgi:hypothetical protein